MLELIHKMPNTNFFYRKNSTLNTFIELIYISYIISLRGHRGHDCMVVGLTTTYAISAYYH